MTATQADIAEAARLLEEAIARINAATALLLESGDVAVAEVTGAVSRSVVPVTLARTDLLIALARGKAAKAA